MISVYISVLSFIFWGINLFIATVKRWQCTFNLWNVKISFPPVCGNQRADIFELRFGQSSLTFLEFILWSPLATHPRIPLLSTWKERPSFSRIFFFSLNGSKIHLWKDCWSFRGKEVNLNSMNIQKHVYSVPSPPRALSADNAGFIWASEGDLATDSSRSVFPMPGLQNSWRSWAL